MTGWVQKKRPDGEYELVPRDELNAWLAKHYPPKPGPSFIPKRVERGRWILRNGELIRVTAEIVPFRHGMQIIKDIEPFQNVAIDRNEIIGGRKQKRDMMRARGVVECGDMPALPKPVDRYDPKKHQLSVVNSLKQALHKHGLGD